MSHRPPRAPLDPLPRESARALRVHLDPGLGSVLDHVRWLAAFLVLIAHARLHTIGSYGGDIEGAGDPGVRMFFLVTGLGHEAVLCFLVLSGVLVAGKFVVGAPGREDYVGYVVDRLTRIWTVAAPALLFSVLLAETARQAFGGLLHPPAAACRPGPLDLGANLLFLHKAFWPTLCSDGPYWSIHNEVWYYLLFPSLVFIFTASSRPTRLVNLAVVTVAAGALLAYDLWDAHNTLALFPVWMAGTLVLVGRRRLLPPWLALMGFLGALLLARGGELHFLAESYVVGGTLVLLLATLRHTPPPAWLVAPPSVALGRRLAGFSYSLYLTHAPLIFFIRTALETQTGLQLPIRALNGVALSVMLVEIVAALAVAQVFHLAFERHTATVRAFVRARLGRGPGGAPAPPAVAALAPPAAGFGRRRYPRAAGHPIPRL